MVLPTSGIVFDSGMARRRASSAPDPRSSKTSVFFFFPEEKTMAENSKRVFDTWLLCLPAWHPTYAVGLEQGGPVETGARDEIFRQCTHLCRRPAIALQNASKHQLCSKHTIAVPIQLSTAKWKSAVRQEGGKKGVPSRLQPQQCTDREEQLPQDGTTSEGSHSKTGTQGPALSLVRGAPCCPSCHDLSAWTHSRL